MKSAPPGKVRGQVLMYVGELLTLFAIYFSTARLGLSLDAVSRFATLVWFPSGTAVAALLLFGYRLWPAILLGAFLVNLFNGAPLVVAVGIGIGNTLEALVATFLLKRNGFSYALDHLRDVLVLVLLAMPLSAFISATIGVSSLFLGKVISFSAYAPTWRAWWIGDMISILILTPFFLTWSTWPREKVSLHRLAELGILTVFVLAVGLLVFGGLLQTDQRSSPMTYLVFPPLIWASLRFGPRGALSAILAFSSLAIVGTIRGFVSFSSAGPSESLVYLQSFMGVIAVTSILLAAVMAERRELEQRKDAFIVMASHELKTPITTLKVLTHLLKGRFEQQRLSDPVLALAKMEKQIDRLTRLVNDLLDVTKIHAGRLDYAEERIALDALLRDSVETAQQMSTTHILTLHEASERDIIGDSERLEQVFLNLMSNAIKYSPQADKVDIHLTTAEDRVIVSVRDYGIGIPKEHHSKIFERFYRVLDVHDNTFPGLGMGLYVASEIVKRHGGRLWVESTEGKGATFFVSLPVA
jgi:signal transduction histidine kinase